MNAIQSKGKVILAGAGPGDVELITIKLANALQQADVIITDRLVNPEIVNKYARATAKVIVTGKQGYNEFSISQEEINQLLIDYAVQGNNVVRLKGGDIAFFSNVLDELTVMEKNEIPFEIIPGITAASGASAYSGIPLTARGFSQGVQFLTFNPNSYYSTERWKELAKTNETLVFYMAAKNVLDVAELLLRYSRKPNTAMAIIEQATTVHQQIHITTLKDCGVDFAGRQFGSPSLIIIGEVVALHRRFNWFTESKEGSVFQELEK
jgi:uroporphyrin-III C-methyltransferase